MIPFTSISKNENGEFCESPQFTDWESTCEEHDVGVGVGCVDAGDCADVVDEDFVGNFGSTLRTSFMSESLSFAAKGNWP